MQDTLHPGGRAACSSEPGTHSWIGFEPVMYRSGEMKEYAGKIDHGCTRMVTIRLALVTMILLAPLQAEQISLQAIVTPSTTISKDGRPVRFALHGFIEFKPLA